jgi:uncharacterized pyridoxamine 5'-phosphate oxidase family protein
VEQSAEIRRKKLNEVYDFIKKCAVYYLATVEGDQPRVRPFGTINIFDGKLYVQTGKTKSVSKQLQQNPKAELCCFDGKNWLRLAGELVRDDRMEAKESMLNAHPSLKKKYSAGDSNTEVLFFRNAAATFTDLDGNQKSVQF